MASFQIDVFYLNFNKINIQSQNMLKYREKHLKIRIKFSEKIISIKNHTPSKYATTDKYRRYLSVFKKNTDTDRYSVGIQYRWKL